MLKIPADLILLKGGVLVRWSTCLLYILFFSSPHSEVDILLQTQCLSLNFDANIYISAVRSQNEIEQPLPQSSSRSVYACTNTIFLRMYQEYNTMTIARDIIRVFYHTIMAVCSTVYIHLNWGSQKTESIILGSCFCWDHLQLGNSHIVSMIPGSGHSLYLVLAPGYSFWKGLRVMAGASTYHE